MLPKKKILFKSYIWRPFPSANFSYHMSSQINVFWVKILENSFAKKFKQMTNATWQRWPGEQTLHVPLAKQWWAFSFDKYLRSWLRN